MKKTLNFIEKINNSYNICKARIPQALLALPGSELWQKYLKGEIKLIKNDLIKESLFPTDKKYENIPWVVPYYYLIKNHNLSDQELKEFIFSEIKKFQEKFY